MTSPHLWWWWWGILRWNSSPGTNTGRSDSPRFSSGSPTRHGHTLNYWLPQPWVIPSDSSVTATRRCGGCPHLAVPHSLVMVAVGDQHVEQGALQTCFRLEEDVVRKGPMNVWPKKKRTVTLLMHGEDDGWPVPPTIWASGGGAEWRSARAWRPHLHGWSPSAGLGAARPAGPGNNRGGSPVVPVRH